MCSFGSKARVVCAAQIEKPHEGPRVSRSSPDAADAADDLYLTREYQMELLSRRADVMVSDNELESDNEMESGDEEESVDVSPRSNRRDPSRGASRGEGGGAGDGLCLSALSVCANCL